MDITISPFTIETYDQVIALWQQTAGIGLSSADSRENIQTYLARNPGMSFYRPVPRRSGGGHTGRSRRPARYIHHLAVQPDCRRQGLGRTLVDRCLSVLQQAVSKKSPVYL